MSGKDCAYLSKINYIHFLSLTENKKMADVTAYMGVDPAIADVRREGSVERGEIRYDVATRAGDIRRETAEGISEVRYDVATRTADNRYANAVGQSDIRREQAIGFGDVKYSIAEHSEATNRDVLTSGFNTNVKVDEAADKIQQRAADFYIAGQARDFDQSRDLAALRAVQDLSAQKLSSEILLATEKTATAAALESAKVAAAVALGQSQLSKEIAENKYAISNQVAENKYELSKQIAYENEKTRDLINSLKNDELNRLLIERNTDLTACRGDYWSARDGLFNSQFAALSSQVNSQLNALNSQIAETRQGMVNFGTMAGVGQSSTSNAVR
jgi:hypothetical protein